MGAAVAARAVERLIEGAAGEGVGRERSVGLAVRAFRNGGKRGNVGGERVEVAAEAGLRVAERLGAGAGGEVGIFHQAEPRADATDLAFEVVDLVEVRRPVEPAVGGAGAAAEVDGVAEAFAEAGEVPGAAVVRAVEVAGGAAHVAFLVEAGGSGVVEESLAVQDLGRERLRGDEAGGGRECRGGGAGGVDQLRDVETGDAAVEVVQHEEPLVRGIEKDPGGRAADGELGDGGAGEGVDDFDLVVTRLGDEGEVAEGREIGGVGAVAVVVVGALGGKVGVEGEVDDRGDRADRLVVGEWVAVEQGAAENVIFLRRQPGAGAVGRDGDG